MEVASPDFFDDCCKLRFRSALRRVVWPFLVLRYIFCLFCLHRRLPKVLHNFEQYAWQRQQLWHIKNLWPHHLHVISFKYSSITITALQTDSCHGKDRDCTGLRMCVFSACGMLYERLEAVTSSLFCFVKNDRSEISEKT